MSLIVELSAETEIVIKELAAQRGRKPEEYAGELLTEQVSTRLAQSSDEDDSRFFERAFDKMRTRTPAEIARVREKMYARADQPRVLPENKNVIEAVYGQLSGDESDAEVLATLQKLS